MPNFAARAELIAEFVHILRLVLHVSLTFLTLWTPRQYRVESKFPLVVIFSDQSHARSQQLALMSLFYVADSYQQL